MQINVADLAGEHPLVASLAFDATGRRLAVGTNGRVGVYDAATGLCLEQYLCEADEARAPGVVADGGYLLACPLDGTTLVAQYALVHDDPDRLDESVHLVEVYDRATGAVRFRQSAGPLGDRLGVVATVSADGSALAVVDAGLRLDAGTPSVALVDLVSGAARACVAVPPNDAGLDPDECVFTAAMRDDGARLALATSQRVLVLDAACGRLDRAIDLWHPHAIDWPTGDDPPRVELTWLDADQLVLAWSNRYARRVLVLSATEARVVRDVALPFERHLGTLLGTSPPEPSLVFALGAALDRERWERTPSEQDVLARYDVRSGRWQLVRLGARIDGGAHTHCIALSRDGARVARAHGAVIELSRLAR
jgi:hypothetical protein